MQDFSINSRVSQKEALIWTNHWFSGAMPMPVSLREGTVSELEKVSKPIGFSTAILTTSAKKHFCDWDVKNPDFPHILQLQVTTIQI